MSDEAPLPPEDEQHPDPAERAATRCKIFLGYTSNLVSSGVREHLRYLVQVGSSCQAGPGGSRAMHAATWTCTAA